MHQSTQPHLDPVRPPELILPNKTMDPTIVVAHMGHITSQLIFFDPVDLEIAKRFPIPTPYNREAMPTLQTILEEFFLMFLRSALAPKV